MAFDCALSPPIADSKLLQGMDSLISKLRNHEDNFVERKPEGANRAELRQTIVAFANSVPPGSTAVLFVGIHDDGRLQGVSNPDQLQKTIREICERVCYPPVAYQTEVLEVDGKAVLAVLVPASTNRPHFSGPAFVRRGSESIAASAEVFDELVASRNGKVAAVLRMKGTPVTVTCIQHRLGQTERVADRAYRTTSECRIESCSSLYVRLSDVSSGRNVTEPLDLITVSYDEERHRPMLVIRGA